ncbi:MAG: redoxin family protein [Pseudomonadales bacterium]|jgi:peroxiredoxin|tara:strand:+ start:10892 stop:12982 length:2091 start_codon:yes stop_codon:yes gene_type:complete
MIDQKSNTPLSPKKRQFQPFITIAVGIGLTLLLGLGSQATLAKSTEKTSSHHKGMHASSSVEGVVGMRVDDFQLLDHMGVAHRLFYYSDAPAIVVMTQGNGCPIVRNAVPAYRQVRDNYQEQGVKFFLLNSNLQDNKTTIAKEVADFGFDIPVLVDENQLVGESLNVTRTAEVFVIDPKSRKVVYHGPVDDRLTYQNQKAKAEFSYLSDALDAVIAGETVKISQVDAPGCIVNFPERDNKERHTNISYHDTIAPILEERCVECHQVGGIGPWAMTSYDMIKGFSPMIREVIRTDRMPPWHSDPNIGSFLHDRSLTSNEIKTLVHWIEAGSPRGEGYDPLADPRESLPDWPLGVPDLILTVPSFDVPATGVVDYQRPYVVNPLEEGKWLRASTVKVGSRESVHHVLTGYLKEIPKSGQSNEVRWGASVGGYAVGAESMIAREGLGTYIPAGGAIGLQMHYTPFGREVTDTTQIGLYFYDKRPPRMLRNSVIMDFSIEIPPEKANHAETAYLEFPKDAELFYAFPHAHYRGQSSTLAIRYPDGREEMILSLPKYDFNWQRAYEFKDPIKVPAGAKLIARYTYDNSTQNAANPDPSKKIVWGDQSFEEMLYTAISYRWSDETSADQKGEYQELLNAGRLFGMLDDNIDESIQKDEIRGRAGRRLAGNFDRLDRNGDGALSWQEYSAIFKSKPNASTGSE